MSSLVKICGITTPDAMTAAIESGTDFVGLVFHPASPRYLEIEVAAYLAGYVPESVKKVGLFVDPLEEQLALTLSSVRLDMIQLHGQESPDRVADIRRKFGLPIIKALSIAEKSDLAQIELYAPAADWFLLDAKGSKEMPGGNGLAFDWALLDGFESPRPWMLAGGLTPETVAQAISRLTPTSVDVSSGVESSRGVKDVAKIRAFIEAAKTA